MSTHFVQLFKSAVTRTNEPSFMSATHRALRTPPKVAHTVHCSPFTAFMSEHPTSGDHDFPAPGHGVPPSGSGSSGSAGPDSLFTVHRSPPSCLSPRRGRRVETNHQLWAEPGYGNAGTPCGSPSGAPITNYCSYAPHNNHRGWHQLLIMTREPGKRRPQCLIAFDDRKLCVYDTPRDTVVFVFGD